MFYDETIEGGYVDLKSAKVEDAEFARAVRREYGCVNFGFFTESWGIEDEG